VRRKVQRSGRMAPGQAVEASDSAATGNSEGAPGHPNNQRSFDADDEHANHAA
jgi:hypothetical protein